MNPEMCSEVGWRPCDRGAARRCFVCNAGLCDSCTRAVLTEDGWVGICSSPLCRHALWLAQEYRKEAGRWA